MSLIHWEPIKELKTLRQQMNRLFDEIMHPEQTRDLFSKMARIGWNHAIRVRVAHPPKFNAKLALYSSRMINNTNLNKECHR